jgi:hypothetical protein
MKIKHFAKLSPVSINKVSTSKCCPQDCEKALVHVVLLPMNIGSTALSLYLKETVSHVVPKPVNKKQEACLPPAFV